MVHIFTGNVIKNILGSTRAVHNKQHAIINCNIAEYEKNSAHGYSNSVLAVSFRCGDEASAALDLAFAAI